jgi:hypothetical protein
MGDSLMPQTPITKPKLLLGEGKHDVYFFNALLTYLGINDVQVDGYGGKHGMGSILKTLTTRTGFDQVLSLGITRDADYADDTDDQVVIVQRAFQSVCGALTRANLLVPAAPMIKAIGQPDVRVFILPDNQRAGMLEDVCLATMQATEIDCINTYFDCIARETSRTQLRRNVSKSRVHAWLATQAEPDKNLGQAAQASYLAWDHPAFDSLKQFLRQL